MLLQKTEKPKFLHKSLYNVGISGITLTNYPALIEPQWIEITEHEITVANLPPAFEGFSIVQLTDLHHSSIVTLDYLQACFRQAVRLQPDLVVLTGDYITYQEKYAKPVAQAIREIIVEAGIPTYAVLGNHDHWNSSPDAAVFPLRNRWKGDGSEVFNALTVAGVRVLTNESVLLQRGADRLWLIGCDDFLSGNFDLDRALASVPASAEPRLLLMHNPYPIESIAHHRFDLVLSGHTHGGQISLPFVPSKIGNRYLAGLFYVGESRLYVCRGIGVSGVPIRFMTLPEIAHFRFVCAPT
ncbi:MAG: metallophosphoesterase [Candidatus Poribacteria bacterium]|nr:metallophosphoesterase [Candidatus Poribacteria bacterium]